jgi:hypothetical protein
MQRVFLWPNSAAGAAARFDAVTSLVSQGYPQEISQCGIFEILGAKTTILINSAELRVISRDGAWKSWLNKTLVV